MRKIHKIAIFSLGLTAALGDSPPDNRRLGGETGGPGAPGSESAVPRPYPLERYRPLSVKSPFLRESTAVAVDPKPSFAEDLMVVSVARIEEDYYVGLMNRKTKEYFEAGPGTSEFKVVKVVENNDPMRVRVQISSDGEVATVGFDEGQLAEAGMVAKAPAQKGARPPSTLHRPPVTPSRSGKSTAIRRRIILPKR